MSEKAEKQTIENIKVLYKLHTDGLVPSLFHQVKSARQNTLSMIESWRSALLAQYREEEMRVKAEALRTQKPLQKAEVTESFAELFEGAKKPATEQEKTNEAPKEEIAVEAAKTASEQKKEETATQPSPKAKPQQERTPNSTAFVQNANKPAPAGKQQFVNRQNLNTKPFNGKQYTPNQNAQNKTYNAGASRFASGNGQYQGQQNRFNKTPRTNQSGNGIMGILPKKNSNLDSASIAFGSKDNRFANKQHKNEHSSDEERRVNKKSLMRRGLIEEQDIEERMVARKLKLKKTKVETAPIVFTPITNATITTANLTVKVLSEKIGKPVTEILKQMMILGIMANINSNIDFATAELVASELGVTLEQKLEKTFEEKLKENAVLDDGTNSEKRAPIVTIVGHVDHGKTTLLDYIRKTHVTQGEAGGITQAIGAYSISWKGEKITFIDTPGHEAFINMRKRGTEITDVAVLIVAADDGVKPQTIEAIKHIKEAKAPTVVAITKIDKQGADIERVKQQLTEHEILPEEWGGDAIICPISSVTGQGIDKLLESILLVAEMQELKCNRERAAVGTVIEASLDKNRGPIANIIVQNGTLHVGDNVVSGFALGKVRAIVDDKGRNLKEAGPSMPVSILGFDSVPNAGDSVQAVDEKFSKNVIEERRIKMAQERIENGSAHSLDEFLATPAQEDKKLLNLIVKADNQGSAEAVKQSLLQIVNDEVKIEIVSCGVGNITENDIILAKVSNATIISFDTKVLAKISNFAKQNKVEIREYNIIYNAIEDIEKLVKSMMAPKFVEKVCGHAEVRALFKISSVGTIAGSYVLDGKIVRNSSLKVTRNNEVIFEGKLSTLKRGKDDAKEVNAGFECGIKIAGFNDVEVGDIIECTIQEQIQN